MLFERINLEHKLKKLRVKQEHDAVLEEVAAILENHISSGKQIEDRLKRSASNAPGRNDFIFDKLATERIYHIDSIKKLCVDYRLRFLHTKYFKGNFPQKTLKEITRLETVHNIQMTGFKIVAPSKLFKLENADDPLLFAPIGNGYYYLIDKWGNDLHPLRKLMMLPFKNFENMVAFVVLLSLLVTWMVPNGLFSKEQGAMEFWMIFFFMFKAIGAVVIFYGFALGKNFNTAIWDSRFFNA